MKSLGAIGERSWSGNGEIQKLPPGLASAVKHAANTDPIPMSVESRAA